MESDGSYCNSIVEISDLDSNATLSPMLPGLYSIFEQCNTLSSERNEDCDGGDHVVSTPVVKEDRDRVNIDDDDNAEDISPATKEHSVSGSDTDDDTEDVGLPRETAAQCQPIDVTDDVIQPASDAAVTCCDSDTTTQGDKQDLPAKHATVDMSQDCVTADNDSVEGQSMRQPVDVTDDVIPPASDAAVTCCDSDTTTQGDKQDLPAKLVTVDMSQDGVAVDDDSVKGQDMGWDGSERKREETEVRDDTETQGTQLSPCLLGPTRKISPKDEHISGLPSKLGKAGSNKGKPTTSPGRQRKDGLKGNHPAPNHLPVHKSPPHQIRGHKTAAKAVQRHEQEMTVLNKVETQLSLAKSALEKGCGSGKETVSKTLTALRPLLGQLSRSQKQERDRIQRELTTSGATTLKKASKVLLVRETQLLHERQRRLVTLVQQYRRLVESVGTAKTESQQRKVDQSESLKSFPSVEKKEGNSAVSASGKSQTETPATSSGKSATQDRITKDVNIVAVKNKSPPDETTSYVAKKQKTSLKFEVPLKIAATRDVDRGNGGNSAVFPGGKTLNDVLRVISENSEIRGHVNVGRGAPQCHLIKLVPQCNAGSVSILKRSSNSASSTIPPSRTVPVAATTVQSICHPQLTSMAAVTSRYINHSVGAGPQALRPATVVVCQKQNPPSANTSSVLSGRDVFATMEQSSSQHNSHAIGRNVTSGPTRYHTGSNVVSSGRMSTVSAGDSGIMTIVQNTMPSGVLYPDVKTLISDGLITPGTNVLSVQTSEKTVQGSLLQNGSIVGEEGVLYKTPTGWCKALLGNTINPNSIKKKFSYQRVLYDGKPLARFKLTPQMTPQMTPQLTPQMTLQMTPQMTGGSSQDVPLTSNNPVNASEQVRHESSPEGNTVKIRRTNLCALMGKCYVTLISDAELCPSHSFLPSDFWDTPGFMCEDLPKELIDSIELW